MSSFWWWAGLTVELAGLLLIPHILLRKRNPVSALAWIWGLLLFPMLGPLCYLGFGTEAMQRKRLRRKRVPLPKEDAAALAAAPSAEILPAFARRLERAVGRSFTSGDRFTLIPEAGQFYADLGEAIDSAQSSIHLEFFIWKDDAIGQTLLASLIRAARRKVAVRLLLDEVGSWSLQQRFFRELEAAGGNWSWFSSVNPLRQRWFLHLRNHRKLAVIDGRRAYCGGMNVGQEYCEWRDLHARCDGPVVTELQGVFADDWFFASGERLTAQGYYPIVEPAGESEVLVLAAGPDQSDTGNHVRTAFLSLMGNAQTRLWIASPYLVPDPAISAALMLAARGGVDVRLLLPAKPDSFYIGTVARSFYDDFLASGIRIFEYQATMLHMKALVLDEAWAMTGSANLDVRSLKLNFELNLLVHCPATNAELCRIFCHDMSCAKEFQRAAFARRPVARRLLEASLRLLAPVL